MQEVGRERPTIAVQFKNRWPVWCLFRHHADDLGDFTALGEIARRTSRHDVVPSGQATA